MLHAKMSSDNKIVGKHRSALHPCSLIRTFCSLNIYLDTVDVSDSTLKVQGPVVQN